MTTVARKRQTSTQQTSACLSELQNTETCNPHSKSNKIELAQFTLQFKREAVFYTLITSKLTKQFNNSENRLPTANKIQKLLVVNTNSLIVESRPIASIICFHSKVDLKCSATNAAV